MYLFFIGTPLFSVYLMSVFWGSPKYKILPYRCQNNAVVVVEFLRWVQVDDIATMLER